MKYILFLFTCLSVLNGKAEISEEKSPCLDNGFLMRVGVGITSSNYGFPEYYVNEQLSTAVPNSSLGFEIGNYWYLWRHADETMGVALNVNWFDLQLATASNQIAESSIVNLAINEIGPVYTYAIKPEMGIDFYFNLRTTILVSSYNYKYYSYNNPNYNNDYYYNDDYSNAGFGFTYALGANFRWKVLMVGVEYGFGVMKFTPNDYDYYNQSPNYPGGYQNRERVSTGLFKFQIGVKF